MSIIIQRTIVIGSPRLIRITAAVISLFAVSVLGSAVLAAEPGADHARRQAALTWAIALGEQSLSAVLPAYSRKDVVDPICKVLTLRSGNISDDHREFRIAIAQGCDGTIVRADVEVARAPFVVQLAKLRYAEGQITAASAIERLEVDRYALAKDDARRIVKSFDQAHISLAPTHDLILGATPVEVSIASWGEIRVLAYLDDHRSGWRQLNAAIRDALRRSKIDIDQLAYDPHDVER